jgi:hypothetical protein
MELRPVFTEEGITYVYIKVKTSISEHHTIFLKLFSIVQQYHPPGRH